MSIKNLDMIRTVVQVVAFAIGGALLVIWGIKNGWFRLQRETVETYREAIAGLQLKVGELEERIASLEAKNDELQGEIEGRDLAIETFVENIARSGLCAKAWECEQRAVPESGTMTRTRRRN